MTTEGIEYLLKKNRSDRNYAHFTLSTKRIFLTLFLSLHYTGLLQSGRFELHENLKKKMVSRIVNCFQFKHREQR